MPPEGLSNVHSIRFAGVENARIVNMAFVIQLAPDICHKSQKLNGFAAMTATWMIEVAQKVYHNREGKKWELRKNRQKY